MPIQATFTADVSSLRKNLETASTAITGLKRTSTQVNADLRRFGNDFSGFTLIRRAETMAKAIKDIGGAAVLSDANLKRVNATVSEAIAQYGRLGQTAPAAMRALHGEVAQLVKAQQALTAAPTGIQGGALGSLLGKGAAIGAGAGLAVGGLQAIGAGIRQIAEDGARLSALGRAFEQLQGGSVRAADSIEVARKATRGLVADADLMQAANKATLLGLDAMGIDFGELADVATKLGRAMGMDATKSVDDLTTALSRQSPQILDNLGIRVDLVAANEQYAASLGKSASALTEEERKLAFATAAMEAARAKAADLGDISLTAADNIGRIGNALRGLGADAASALNQAEPLVRALEKWADIADRLRSGGRVSFADMQQNAMDRFWSDGNLGAGALGALMWATAGTEGRESIAAARERRARGVGAESDLARAAALQGQLDQWRASMSGADAVAEFSALLRAGSVSTPGASATSKTATAELAEARRALAALTQQQRESIAAAKELGQSNREAAASAGTSEAVVKLWERQGQVAKQGTAEAERWRAEVEKLTGVTIIRDAERLAQQLDEVRQSSGAIPSAKVDELTRSLMAARDMAQQTGQAISQGVSEEIEKLVRTPEYRRAFSTYNGSFNRLLATGETTGGYAVSSFAGYAGSDLLSRTYGTPGTWLPSSNPLSATMSAAPVVRSYFETQTKATKDWAEALRSVSQAFGTLSQITGGLDPVSRLLGTATGGISAGQSLAKVFGLSGRQGGALTAALAGGSVGLQLGSMTTNPYAGAGMGALGGAATGYMAAIAMGAKMGSAGGFVGAGIGAGIGALGGIYSAQKNKQAQYGAKDAGMAQILAQYDGSLDTLLKTVTDLGLNGQKFLQGWYGDAKAFTAQTQLLTSALAKEEAQVKALAKSFEGVSAAQGVLSRDQIAQIVGTRQGGPGQDAVLEFVNAQRGAAESGLQRAIDALLRRASLTDAEIEALTKDIRDEKDRERKIEEALKAKAGETLQTFGLGIQAAGAGLMAAFSAAVEAGESALSVLRRMQPSIDALKTIYDRAGVQPGAGFGQLSLYQDIASGASGDALEVASGLGQALAGFQNSALLSPELFQELANGIGQAYGEMERLGKGGLDAARLMQPALQAIWQLAQDDPGLLDMLDDQTRALLDFATQSGLVGDKFRPAIDRMVDALDRLITKFDEYLQRLGAASNATLPAPQVGVGDSSNANGGEYGETPGFDGGTGGLRNFGRESLVRLHGREAVLTEGQYHALNAAARLNLSHTPVSAGMPIRIESTTILNGRKVGLSVQEVTPTLHRMYGAAA